MEENYFCEKNKYKVKAIGESAKINEDILKCESHKKV